MCCLRTLEQPQLDVLAMQLRIASVTALLPHIFANDGFIPMTAYGTDEIPFGPKLASPQTLFDGGDAVEDLTGRETFDDLDDLRRAITRHRLHEKLDMLLIGPNFSKGDFIPLGDVSTDLFQHRVDFCGKDDAAILRRTHDVGKQGRDVVPFMPIVAHARDNNTREKAEASFEESDPRD